MLIYLDTVVTAPRQPEISRPVSGSRACQGADGSFTVLVVCLSLAYSFLI